MRGGRARRAAVSRTRGEEKKGGGGAGAAGAAVHKGERHAVEGEESEEELEGRWPESD